MASGGIDERATREWALAPVRDNEIEDQRHTKYDSLYVIKERDPGVSLKFVL